MTEVPTNEWSHDFDVSNALRDAPPLPCTTPQWLRRLGVVAHVFTHFPLELTVYTAEVGAKTPAPAGMRWVALADLPGEALPNVMRKVLVHAGRFPAEAPDRPNGASPDAKPVSTSLRAL